MELQNEQPLERAVHKEFRVLQQLGYEVAVLVPADWNEVFRQRHTLRQPRAQHRVSRFARHSCQSACRRSCLHCAASAPHPKRADLVRPPGLFLGSSGVVGSAVFVSADAWRPSDFPFQFSCASVSDLLGLLPHPCCSHFVVALWALFRVRLFFFCADRFFRGRSKKIIF